ALHGLRHEDGTKQRTPPSRSCALLGPREPASLCSTRKLAQADRQTVNSGSRTRATGRVASERSLSASHREPFRVERTEQSLSLASDLTRRWPRALRYRASTTLPWVQHHSPPRMPCRSYCTTTG